MVVTEHPTYAVRVSQHLARRTGHRHQAFAHTRLVGNMRDAHGNDLVALDIDEGALIIHLIQGRGHPFQPSVRVTFLTRDDAAGPKQACGSDGSGRPPGVH
jgi:hypothetical protein